MRKVGNKHMVDESDLEAVTEEPRSVGVPPVLTLFESGESQPDWVKLIHHSRAAH